MEQRQMKVIVNYNPETGMISSGKVPDIFVGFNLEFPKAEDQEKIADILALAKQGYSAQDLVELKKQDII